MRRGRDSGGAWRTARAEAVPRFAASRAGTGRAPPLCRRSSARTGPARSRAQARSRGASGPRARGTRRLGDRGSAAGFERARAAREPCRVDRSAVGAMEALWTIEPTHEIASDDEAHSVLVSPRERSREPVTRGFREDRARRCATGTREPHVDRPRTTDAGRASPDRSGPAARGRDRRVEPGALRRRHVRSDPERAAGGGPAIVGTDQVPRVRPARGWDPPGASVSESARADDGAGSTSPTSQGLTGVSVVQHPALFELRCAIPWRPECVEWDVAGTRRHPLRPAGRVSLPSAPTGADLGFSRLRWTDRHRAELRRNSAASSSSLRQGPELMHLSGDEDFRCAECQHSARPTSPGTVLRVRHWDANRSGDLRSQSRLPP